MARDRLFCCDGNGNGPASVFKKEHDMLKIAFAAAATTLFVLSPALAADKLACNDDGMMKVEMMLKEKTAMKVDTAMATKENDMAMMAKKDGKMDDCAMHLNMAQEELMKP
jgi:hypothetical protein